ncbi:MAG: metallophosphoesterase [Lachnospiraceae bacterium]|jgi:predicted MPP superfamily phosphohydrolase|nr:metallophosphoesterase [Lachnospiraceae bacterium]
MWEDFVAVIETFDLTLADIVGWAVWALVIILMVALIVINVRDANRFVVREYYFCSAELLKNAKLLVIADLHNKEYGRGNQNLWNAVELIAPDYILIAGDMITAYRHQDNTPALTFLRKLAAKYPVYYANGNHEHRLSIYAEQYGTLTEEFEQAVEEMPLRRLRNQHVFLAEMNLAIHGLDLDREYYRRWGTNVMEAAYLTEALGEPPEGCINLLVAHNPEYFPQYVEWGADLVVSGHVHGGLVRLPFIGGIFAPKVMFFPKYDGGVYMSGKSQMILSRGLGTHTIPIRIFNPGELVVVHMRH